jgi:phosphoribosylformimino-5-aminoimidazole carboxamide ribotide isomerase
MRVIGVIDLLGGRAVHATGGNRSAYKPVASIAATPIPNGDALAVAREYMDGLGIEELYAADLDAILREHGSDSGATLRGESGSHAPLGRALASLGAPLWLDAAVSSVESARLAVAAGASRVIVGLETLRSFGDLRDISAAIGPERTAFSLDVRGGVPVTSRLDPRDVRDSPPAVARAAVEAGASAVIVIDLGRVGSGGGPDVVLLAGIKEAVPGSSVFAGGGVRGLADVARLADIGCDGVLVATALQSGKLDRSSIRAAGAFGQASATR